MNATIYLDDKSSAFAAVRAQVLTDGSQVWNMLFPGSGVELPFASEKQADEAFEMLARSLRMSMQEVLVL